MILSRMGAFVARLDGARLSARVVHAAKRCVIDWFAATVPGGSRPPATLLADALEEDLDRGPAVLVPSGRRATMRTAALINGAASHVLEFDDIYRDALYHPGAPVISAVLAAAQGRRKGGRDVLTAVVAGYEVSNRIGLAVNPAHYEYWHTTGTVGMFGAAAGAARVFGLDARATTHALANAATMAAGLQQAFRSEAMSKPLHAGRAAETGVLVAMAAEVGVTGATGMLEGPRGFGAAMSRDVDWSTALDGLGDVYTIVDTTQKNHAACGHTFAAIDAVLALRAEHGLSGDTVRRISVGTYGKALEIAGIENPKTPYEAKFSLAYCLALALLDGRVRLDAFSPERLSDAAVADVMGRVEAHVDAEADAAFPKRRSATVEIETTDGRTLRHHAPTRKGDPDAPFTDRELVDKYRELVDPVLGRPRSLALLDALWGLEERAAVDDLPPAPVPVYASAAGE